MKYYLITCMQGHHGRGRYTEITFAMMARNLIDADDYCAIETKYAVKFRPLFRYEKPCKSATLPLTLTGQGRP